MISCLYTPLTSVSVRLSCLRYFRNPFWCGDIPNWINTNLRPQDNPQYSETKCIASVCDIVNDSLPQHVPENGIDVAMLIFVLSAIAPEKMTTVMLKIKQV